MSTENAVQQFLNDIYTVFSRSEYAICIFMDLRKAFDTMHHGILLEKLRYYGVYGNALNGSLTISITVRNLCLWGTQNRH